MCNYNNPIWNNACKLFFVLQAILISNLIDIYCTYFISKMISSQTEAAKSLIGENTYISRKKYVDHTLSKIERLKKLNVQFYAHFSFLFRDNGITVQLMKYQLYTETFVFLLNFFLVFLPSERDILTIRIIGILNTFMTFVIYPLFYLSGDVNFRNRVLHKGLWLAIKTELFSSTSMVGPSFM